MRGAVGAATGTHLMTVGVVALELHVRGVLGRKGGHHLR